MSKKKSGNAVIYARYSSHNQRDVSIEQQIEACENYARENGFTIVARYADRAVSGKTDNRPQFQKMMKEAHNGGWDYVIAWKSNRMGRNMLQAMVNEAKLADLGIKCLYVEEDFDDTAAGRFALRSMMNVNQFYSENMAEDIRRGLMDNAQKCKVNGRLPLGYVRGKDGKYAIDDAGAAVVREIFQKITDGWSIVDIAADLNNRGIKTSIGGPWKKQSFDKLLQNENYIGVYKYAGVRIEGGIPAIINKDHFEEVQEILRTKPNARGKTRLHSAYLLSGKVFCGICGSPMGAQCGTARDGTKRDYYMCNRRRYNHACDKRTVPKAALERAVVDCVRSELMDDKFVDWVMSGYSAALQEAQDTTRIDSLQQELDACNAKLQNILNAIEAGIFNEHTQERMNELTEQRNSLEADLAAERIAFQFPTPEDMKFDLLELRNSDFNDPECMRELIKTFVKAVYVYDDKLRIQFNYGKEKEPPFPPGDGSRNSCQTPPKVIFVNRAFTVSFFEVEVSFTW